MELLLSMSSLQELFFFLHGRRSLHGPCYGAVLDSNLTSWSTGGPQHLQSSWIQSVFLEHRRVSVAHTTNIRKMFLPPEEIFINMETITSCGSASLQPFTS